MPSSELLRDFEDKRQTPTGNPYTCVPLNKEVNNYLLSYLLQQDGFLVILLQVYLITFYA